ncbi:MarR family winged helix-turn-helix transcriptional regulator [Devosia sp. ZW T5_3]|uniref:MarR family winged helix-turn-helix transcriptional regulator n=1 Tax=Devosia sp. ZW T5_3 TaxID=3378085 RepID=UPI003851C215
MSRKGADLALLLLGGFRQLADSAGVELLRRGYPELRPSQEFAMRAISGGVNNASELGRRLSISKQAAAKVVALLEERGYVARMDDTADSRRKLLTVTPLGHEVMRQGETIFEELRAAWAQKIGEPALDRLEQDLLVLVGDAAVDLDAPSLAGLEED